jgi:hypothetical protein
MCQDKARTTLQLGQKTTVFATANTPYHALNGCRQESRDTRHIRLNYSLNGLTAKLSTSLRLLGTESLD